MADDVIRVEVLGTPRILKNGVETSFSRKRVRALLFYLATELKPVPRTTLAWLFWPDKSPQVASRNLSIHLSYLKKCPFGRRRHLIARHHRPCRRCRKRCARLLRVCQ